MNSSAERRLRRVTNHLEHSAVNQPPVTEPTAAEFCSEKLQCGKWNVYRNRRSPLQLVSRFVDHPNIATLHDNFEHAVDTYQDYKYLGTRVRDDGTVGEYTWMTYREADASRSTIGSALIRHGIAKGSCIGLCIIFRFGAFI